MKAIVEIGNKKFLFDSEYAAADLVNKLSTSIALGSSYVYNQDLEILDMTDCKNVYWKEEHHIEITVKDDFQLLPKPLKDHIKDLKQKGKKEVIVEEGSDF